MDIIITDESQRRLERYIDALVKDLELYRRVGLDILATQADERLFGIQLGLDMLGLHDLAMMAAAAQKFDTTE